jgi:hypothetical protein
VTSTVFRVLLILCLTFSVSPSRAGDRPGLKLLRPDSLVGWEYGAQVPSHWIISDGQLTGNPQSTPLLGGWTLGDFELRCQWSVRSSGAWTIGLPEAPSGAGLAIALQEGDACGEIRDGQTIVSMGARVEAPPAGAMHSADIRCSGGMLSVIVDGRVLNEIAVDRNRRFGLSLAVPAGEATLADLRLEEPRGNPLFNGRDFTGWWAPDKKGDWSVQDGQMVSGASHGNNYMRTDKQYANFNFAFEYKVVRGGNSGVAIRTAREGWPSGDGMELQILDQPGEVKDSTMAIYGNLPPLDRADKSEQWNRVLVKAEGRMISVWVNDELVQHADTSSLPELRHRHLTGWIGVQDHGSRVRFRELYVLEAPDGLGLDAWRQRRGELGAAIVLDRLMNTERLSRLDGLGSGVISCSVPKGGEHVLAELTGPGALVRCWRSYAAGRMAFYFDGEQQPRIECAADNLFANVPGVPNEEQPALMSLPYAKSLKIVLRDPLPATYRLDYVTFSNDATVESYSVPRGGVPRGFLPALEYRHEGMNHGKLREAEIYDRVVTAPRTIEPGTTLQLASLDGAGIVKWLRLHADKTALANNDLWLEIAIDGESIPALAAPARFLFPGFAEGFNATEFNSLVMTPKEGFANLMAMPYGTGLTVSARNRGQKPIENVAVSMSVEKATGATRADVVARMRLRGIFQPASSTATDLARQLGTGRLVSLVYDQPDGAATGIASLMVDGKSRDGWAAADLDPFFGRPGERSNFYSALSGRRGSLAWRYLLMEPVSFEQSLELKPTGDQLGDRLALFYVKP